MNQSEINYVKNLVRNVPDFPVKGVQFKDLTPVFKDPKAICMMRDALVEIYRGKGITKVLGIESRGFICAPMLAAEIGAGFVPVRKPGKLPADTCSITYMKEYGEDSIEIHSDAIEPGDVVLIHDDLLASGGTMRAACELVARLKPARVMVSFLCAIPELKGLEALPPDVDVSVLFNF